MKKKCFVGIDISKKTLDVVIYDMNKKRPDETNYKKVSNSQDGFKELMGWFKSKGMKPSETVVGMEHTGAYGFELRLFLEDHGIDYSAYMRRKNGRGSAEKLRATDKHQGYRQRKRPFYDYFHGISRGLRLRVSTLVIWV